MTSKIQIVLQKMAHTSQYIYAIWYSVKLYKLEKLHIW